MERHESGPSVQSAVSTSHTQKRRRHELRAAAQQESRQHRLHGVTRLAVQGACTRLRGWRRWPAAAAGSGSAGMPLTQHSRELRLVVSHERTCVPRRRAVTYLAPSRSCGNSSLRENGSGQVRSGLGSGQVSGQVRSGRARSCQVRGAAGGRGVGAGCGLCRQWRYRWP